MILENEIALGGSPGPAAYQIERSLRFNSADSAYLSWTPPQAGNRRIWTWSGWVKRTTLGDQYVFEVPDGGSTGFHIRFNASDQLRINDYTVGTDYTYLVSSAVYRDVSAWYHIVVAFDTTQATSSNRAKVYVNGVQVTAFASSTYPTQNQDTAVNSVKSHQFSTGNKYLAEVNFIDGQALTPSDFGETSSSTGVWIPKAYTGTYGNNGFYLPFNDNSTALNLGRNRQTLTADPYFPYTTLLLNGNQPSGVTDTNNNVFKDSSSNNFTITRSGATNNTTQGTFSPFSQTGWSNYFDGTGDSVGCSTNAIAATGQFCFEAWVYQTSRSTTVDQHIFSQYTGGAGGRFYIRFNDTVLAFTSGLASVNGATTLNLNTWYHVVVTRDSSDKLRIFVNGVLDGSVTVTGSLDTTASVVGATASANYWFGYISNVRVVSGSIPTAYQTSSTTNGTSVFTPPTSPLTAVSGTSLLTCNANRFVDGSASPMTLTVNGNSSVQAFSPFAPTAAYSAATNGGSGYFDGTGDYLSSTISAISGTFTIEFWFYRPSSGSNFCFTIGDSQTGGNTSAEVYIGTSGTVLNYWTNNNAQITGTPAAAGQWVYLAVTRDGSNVVRLYQNGTQVGGTYTQSGTLSTALRIGTEWYGGASTGTTNGYIGHFRVSDSVRTVTTVPTAPFSSDANTVFLANFTNAGIVDSTAKNDLETVGGAQISTTQSKWGGSSMYFDGTGDYLTAPASPNNNLNIGDFTLEFWVYRANLTGDVDIVGCGNVSTTGYQVRIKGTTGYVQFLVIGGASITTTTGISATTWTHIAIVRSGTTVKIYINGTDGGGSGTVGNSGTVTTELLVVGANRYDYSNTLNGYIDDLRITKGLARYTGNFTVPAAQFAYNQADINVKQWVPNNFSVTAGVGNDSLVDSPTNYGTDTGAGGEVRGNYCTFNPLDNNVTLANGNLDASRATASWASVRSTFGMTSGKWYWEILCTVTPSASNGLMVGIATSAVSLADYIGASATGYAYNGFDAKKYNNGASSAYGATFTNNDVIGVGFDADAGTLTFYKNGVSQGSAYTGLTSGPYFAAISLIGTASASINCGQRPFAYTAPSGFKALCTQNLPTPAIGASASTLANKYFDALLYTGNGSARSITGLNFQPDLVWLKSRSNLNWWHQLQDAVRGATKRLASNDPDGEVTDAQSLTAFNSNGFSLGTSSSYNNNSDTYVAWNWSAGGSNATNTSGSITSTVRANTTAGFSVVTFTGTGANATVGHGLGVAPKMIILKGRSQVGGYWRVYTAAMGATKVLYMNVTDVVNTDASIWNNTAPTSTVFSIGTDPYTNTNGATYVAYCFAEIPGFSNFGSYTGNASTNGPFVYTGFRPKFVMVKNSSTAGSWWMEDSSRSPYNVGSNKIAANSSAAESTGFDNFDFLSNGFKVRNSGTEINGSGNTIIFMAFAEFPFQYARAR